MASMFVGTFTIGQTLDRGIRLYKKVLGKAIILLIISAALGVPNMQQQLAPTDPTNPFAMFTPLYFISMLFGLWAWVVITRYTYKVSQGEELAFNQVLKLFKASDLLLIISYFIWILVLLVSIIPLAIPFIYLINLMALAAVVVINEEKYFFNGIGRTVSLAKGRWWKTFVINIIAYLLIAVPIGISMGIMVAGMGSTAMASLESASTNGMFTASPLTIVGTILYMVAASVIMPLFLAIITVHYNSLRSEKENVDLDVQLDALGETA